MQESSHIITDYAQYEVIFIGQLGAVVCNIFTKVCTSSFKCLVINNTKSITQTSLLPFQTAEIHIQKLSSSSCDLQTGNIHLINPYDNLISMQNKKFYKYKYLVFGVKSQDWADYSMIENLKQSLQTSYSFVYSNILKNDPKLSCARLIFQQLQNRKKIENKRKNYEISQKNKIDEQNSDSRKVTSLSKTFNIIFYIPKPPHCGYDNINVLYKFQQLTYYFQDKINSITKSVKLQKQMRNQNQQKENYKLNCMVLLQGQHIFPYSTDTDNQIKNYFIQKGIRVLKNHKIQRIDYLRRKINVLNEELKNQKCLEEQQLSQIQENKDQLHIGFDYLYVIIKQKTPQLLQTCKINPFQNCHRTLMNSKFNNLFIIGADLYPTSHSFSSINYQAQIISTNLFKLLKNSHKNSNTIDLTQYNGYTSFSFWINMRQYIKFQHFYQDDVKLKKQKGQRLRKKINCCIKFMQMPLYKILYKAQVYLYYNLKSYGAPYYLFVPQITKIKDST